MKRYEIAIDTNLIDDELVDQMAIGLIRAGYEVYFNGDEEKLCFTADNNDVTDIEYIKVSEVIED